MRTILAATAAIAIILVTGCATKTYGRQPTLTNHERQNLTCREIDNETARTKGFIRTVKDDDKFDARTVLGLLGDFGIGNIIEQDAAMASAQKRLDDLGTLRIARDCDGQLVGAD